MNLIGHDHFSHGDYRIIGRPFYGRPFYGRPFGRPFFYGPGPFFGGFLGGLTAGALLGPYGGYGGYGGYGYPFFPY
ncbi:hypothetical protein PJ311_03920 [Bacillus sp. CLL-7-23]|uniref:Spore coat protein n=1 Tax=Bacillus changyiensis TaxID=3004103 RepID=A0ABT4X0H4_9BACI|nr:hypothetical protein [Bacillus changyiensis]MDA7025758.1 hypothetical protein [Bacillus changyiensis]